MFLAFRAARSALQLGVFFIVDPLAPLVAAALAGHFQGNVAEPAVLLRAVPMLHLSGDHYHAAGGQADGRLALFLIPALTGRAQQQLPAALGRMVNVPVVAAAWLKGYVGRKQAALRVGERVQVRLADKIAGIRGVGRAGAKQVLRFKVFFLQILHGKALLFFFVRALVPISCFQYTA